MFKLIFEGVFDISINISDNTENDIQINIKVWPYVQNCTIRSIDILILNIKSTKLIAVWKNSLTCV